MNIPFINKHSAKCMLGRLSKDLVEKDGVVSWSSRGTNHAVIIDERLTFGAIDRLKELKSANFHYLSQESINTLEKFLKVKKKRGNSVIIDVNNLDFTGKKNRRFRNYLNRYKHLEIKNYLNNKQDLRIMLKKWSEVLGDKYFRNMSGKNFYFVENDYHESCENTFIYDGDELVSFGILSPVINGTSVYIIGKALSNLYPGLAEFTDIKAYESLYNKHGSFSVNLGQGSGKLLYYKMKFPGSRQQTHYHGSYSVC